MAQKVEYPFFKTKQQILYAFYLIFLNTHLWINDFKVKLMLTQCIYPLNTFPIVLKKFLFYITNIIQWTLQKLLQVFHYSPKISSSLCHTETDLL